MDQHEDLWGDPYGDIPKQDRAQIGLFVFTAMMIVGLADGPMNHYERDTIAQMWYAHLRWAKSPRETLAIVESLVEEIGRLSLAERLEGLKPARRLSGVGRRYVLKSALVMARIDEPISKHEDLVLEEIAKYIMVPAGVLAELRQEQQERDRKM